MRFFERSWPVAHAATLARVVRTATRSRVRRGLGVDTGSPPASAPPPLDEIVVTADFRDAKVTDIPASVSVIDAEQLRATTVEHFEEAIREVPNLNLSGEGSRARYFQLRGVGELEQYDGAPNPSLGFIVDDIDFSGLGSIGTLYDVDRVEVLRGPQGTRYGANALGGLIYIRSADPTPELSADFKADGGSDDRARSAPQSAARSATRRASAFRCTISTRTASATTCSSIATTRTAATSSGSTAR